MRSGATPWATPSQDPKDLGESIGKSGAAVALAIVCKAEGGRGK